MTLNKLASDWLKDNTSKASTTKRRQGNTRRLKFVAYDDLDREAFDLLWHMERRHFRRNRGKHKRYLSLPVMEFLHDHKNFDRKHCLLVPGMSPPNPLVVNGQAASRHMCRMAHGEPESGEAARHLCGNGHLSCVNPTHLRWGTVYENIRDKELHRGRPLVWPEMTDEQVAAIKEDDRHPNIIAVDLGLYAAVVRDIKSGST